MAKAYTAGVIITGSADGAVKATKLTAAELEKLNDVQRRTAGAAVAAALSAGKLDAALSQVGKASRLVNDILTGGGLLIAFKTLSNRLGDVATRYAETDRSAAQYLKTQKLLGAAFDQTFLSVLHASGGALKSLSDFLDPAARATARLATATQDLAKAERTLAVARSSNRSGLSAVGGAGNSLDDLAKQVRFQESAVKVAQYQIESLRKAEQDANNAFDPTGGKDLVDRILKASEEARQKESAAREKALNEAKSSADKLAAYNEDLVATRIRNEEAAADAINRYNEEVVQTRARNEEQAFEAAAKETATAQMQAAEESARQSQEIWNNAAEGIQSALTDAFEGAFNSATDFFGSLTDLAKRTFAEIASASVVKQFSGLLAGVTGAGTASASTGILGNLGSVGGLSSLFGSGAAASSGGVFGGTSGGPGFGLGSGYGLGPNLLAGFAGSFVGNELGESAFNKQAKNPAFATTGAILGSYFTPVGTAIGAAIGAAVDVAVGSDVNGKRVKLGISAGTDIATGANSTVTGASGLQISAIGKRLDKESGQALDQLLATFANIDTVLTGAARAAGATVNFAGLNLTNPNSAGREAGANFFGSFRKGEINAEDVQGAANNFVTAWIAQIDNQLPARVRAGLKGVEQTADSIVTAFQGLINIDKLLNLDVVKETDKALEALGQANKSLLGQYDDLTSALMDVSAGYDGSTDSIIGLSDALTAQKSIAVQLAVAYRAVGEQISSTFGSARDFISESVLSEEELYAKRRAQIADLSASLTSTIDPEKIAAISAQIDQLARGAFGLLSDEQKKAEAGGFLSFFDQAQGVAAAQIAAGQASLSGREAGVSGSIDLELARVNQATAEKNAASTDRFAAVVDQLMGLANLPAEIQSTLNSIRGGNFGINSRFEVNGVL